MKIFYFINPDNRKPRIEVDYAHYNDVTVDAIASQITSLTIVYSIVYSDADHRKHQSSASLAFVRGIHRGPVNSPHKWPVTRKMFRFDDVIMIDRHDHSKTGAVGIIHFSPAFTTVEYATIWDACSSPIDQLLNQIQIALIQYKNNKHDICILYDIDIRGAFRVELMGTCREYHADVNKLFMWHL